MLNCLTCFQFHSDQLRCLPFKTTCIMGLRSGGISPVCCNNTVGKTSSRKNGTCQVQISVTRSFHSPQGITRRKLFYSITNSLFKVLITIASFSSITIPLKKCKILFGKAFCEKIKVLQRFKKKKYLSISSFMF